MRNQAIIFAALNSLDISRYIIIDHHEMKVRKNGKLIGHLSPANAIAVGAGYGFSLNVDFRNECYNRFLYRRALMLLRRVIEHVKAQNWTAVALDFVIVVVGVFIGIQVANWNDERQTRHDATVFHKRLLADMRLEAEQYTIVKQYYRSVRKAANAAYADLAGKAPLDDTAFLINAFRASQYSWAERHRATFDELVASGNLDSDRRCAASNDGYRVLLHGAVGRSQP